MDKTSITKTSEETEKLGEEFAKKLKPHDVVLLKGNLGAGKTTFVKGVAKGLSIESRVISPTFVLIRRHKIMDYDSRFKNQGIKTLYHLDLYRLSSTEDVKNINIEDYLSDETGVIFIEWPDKAEGFVKPTWEIEFRHQEDEGRGITVKDIRQKTIDISLEKVVKSFKTGKVGIFPTDTAYGIGCRINNEDAIKRLFKIRKRSENKPLIALVSSVEMAQKYVFINDEVRKKLMSKYWPGGLTIIFKTKPGKVSNSVTSGTDTLAIRFPNHKQLCSIIKKVGVPIVAPSANFSGEPTPLNRSEVDEKLIKKVDFILSGVCTIKGVSTIVDSTVSPWEIVRQGAVEISV